MRTPAAWRPGWLREGGWKGARMPAMEETKHGGQGDESSRLSKPAHAARAARSLPPPPLALPPRSSLACVASRNLAPVQRRAPPPPPALSRPAAPADLTAYARRPIAARAEAHCARPSARVDAALRLTRRSG